MSAHVPNAQVGWGLYLVRLFFWPFWKITGWHWHDKSAKLDEHCWLDRGYDEIPEYVVRAGLLIYTIVFVPGVLLMLGCTIAWLLDTSPRWPTGL